MPRKKHPEKPSVKRSGDNGTEMRIIGGHFRGSKLRYHGDPIVRPMKHRVREAICNLISTDFSGRHVIDLFGGTGALGLEALSRGAANALFIEKHVPTARVLEENISRLNLESRCTLRVTSAFLWGKRDLQTFAAKTTEPWLVFCSPPYDFYLDRQEEMLLLLESVIDHAPLNSIVVVEADERFDFQLLPGDWDVRAYPPATIGILRLHADMGCDIS